MTPTTRPKTPPSQSQPIRFSPLLQDTLAYASQTYVWYVTPYQHPTSAHVRRGATAQKTARSATGNAENTNIHAQPALRKTKCKRDRSHRETIGTTLVNMNLKPYEIKHYLNACRSVPPQTKLPKHTTDNRPPPTHKRKPIHFWRTEGK